MTFEEVWQTVSSWALHTGMKLIISIVLLLVSFRFIDFVGRKITKKAEKSQKLDKTLYTTLTYVGKIVAKILVTLAIVSYLGIDTGGITAVIASLGVGIGLAVNGALSNMAGGVLLVITRPFRIDDYIEALGYGGTVENIHICTTRLRTPDNKVVYLPNGALSTGNIVNYSQKETRRVDVTFSVAYSADFGRAVRIVKEICEAHPLILKDPAPFVRMTAQADSCVELTARVWSKNSDYWDVKFDLLEQVKAAFDREGIEIPFPQMDVHIRNNEVSGRNADSDKNA